MPSEKSRPSENNQSFRHIDDTDSVFKGATKLVSNDFDQGVCNVSDALNDQTDIDVWRFHLNHGDHVTISTDTVDGFTPDTVVALFDNRGTLLSYNDDGGFGTWESLLEHTASTDGNYFLAVSQFPSFPTGGGDFAHGGPEYSLTDYWTGPGDYDLSILIA